MRSVRSSKTPVAAIAMTISVGGFAVLGASLISVANVSSEVMNVDQLCKAADEAVQTGKCSLYAASEEVDSCQVSRWVDNRKMTRNELQTS